MTQKRPSPNTLKASYCDRHKLKTWTKKSFYQIFSSGLKTSYNYWNGPKGRVVSGIPTCKTSANKYAERKGERGRTQG